MCTYVYVSSVCKQYVDLRCLSVWRRCSLFVRMFDLRDDLTVAVVLVACCRRRSFVVTLAFNVGC